MFSDFPLDPEVVARLDKLGFNKAFEVQDKTLSLTLDGRFKVQINNCPVEHAFLQLCNGIQGCI